MSSEAGTQSASRGSIAGLAQRPRPFHLRPDEAGFLERAMRSLSHWLVWFQLGVEWAISLPSANSALSETLFRNNGRRTGAAMKAARYKRQGSASEVPVIGEIPTTHPGAGEVRIRVFTSGINPGKVKKRRDAFGIWKAHPGVIPHSDGSEVIDEVGNGVSASRVGERVYCRGERSASSIRSEEAPRRQVRRRHGPTDDLVAQILIERDVGRILRGERHALRFAVLAGKLVDMLDQQAPQPLPLSSAAHADHVEVEVGSWDLERSTGRTERLVPTSR